MKTLHLQLLFSVFVFLVKAETWSFVSRMTYLCSNTFAIVSTCGLVQTLLAQMTGCQF